LGTDFLRPYQGYSDITNYNFDADADYNSLQVALNRRFSQGITFGVAYTWSKTMTTISDDGTFTRLLNPSLDYQLAAFDRTHYLVGNFVWDLPKGSKLVGGSKAAGLFLDNWVLSGVTSLASGQARPMLVSPFSGVDSGSPAFGHPTAGNLSGNQMRFLLNGDPQSGSTINMSALAVPALGNIGPYPRTYLRNPWIANQDLSVFKNIPFQRRREAVLAASPGGVSTPFNHPQLSGLQPDQQRDQRGGARPETVYSAISPDWWLRNNYSGRPGSASVLGNLLWGAQRSAEQCASLRLPRSSISDVRATPRR